MSLITLFTLICACIAVYAIWTIRVSRQKQHDLLSEFKKTDRSLKRSNDPLQKSSPGVGAFRRNDAHLPEVELAIKASAIIRCIDSMKHELVILSKQKEAVPFSYPDKSRLIALKNRLTDYNAFIQEHFPAREGIKQNDLVNIADVPDSKALVPWEVYYFTNSTVFGIISELTFIKTQVLRLQQKAIN